MIVRDAKVSDLGSHTLPLRSRKKTADAMASTWIGGDGYDGN